MKTKRLRIYFPRSKSRIETGDAKIACDPWSPAAPGTAPFVFDIESLAAYTYLVPLRPVS
jgi:L-ascorbate metabolism protein UlaG (beta-lactamase superfamily)